MATLRECSFTQKCVACGARYRPMYYMDESKIIGKQVVMSSNHVCDQARLKKREEQLRHEWDDPDNYCDCGDLDCKFEFIDAMRNEME